LVFLSLWVMPKVAMSLLKLKGQWLVKNPKPIL
jgi:hypothetical protein